MARGRFNLVLAAALVWLANVAAVRAAEAGDDQARGDQAAAARHFDEQIAPLLARRCLDCHNPADNKGELDLTRPSPGLLEREVLVPGKPEASGIWQKIRDGEMPPKRPLVDSEKKLLSDWIASGATWGNAPIDRLRYTSDVRAGHDWWALQPVKRPELPAIKNPSWAQGAIDRFVLARLETAGIAPSEPADRRTLFRRLNFDLTGLPPAPEAVAAFVADDDPAAYEKLVDRLLASPEYGRCWARHWLDLARFGESNGFEYDEPRPDAWPYRDWVIDALNRDLPYDEFARQQLAGDAIALGDRESIKATGFLVAGAFDTAGQSQQSAAMKAVVRQDELEDIVGTVGQTFLGLSVHCARCHDHKFDPIRQSEYYQLTSALAGVRHGKRDVTPPALRTEFAKRAEAARRRIEELTARIAALEAPAREQMLADRAERAVAHPAPVPLARWDFDVDLRDRLGGLHGETHGKAATGTSGLVLDGKRGFVATAHLEKDLTAKTLEAWVRLADLKQSGGGVMSVQTLDGAVFDAIVFAERESGHWLAGSDNFSRTQDFQGSAETEADQQTVHIAIVYAADGAITAYRNGQPYGKPYRAPGPAVFPAGQAQVLFGLRHAPAGGNRMLRGAIERAQLHDRALDAEEVAASAGMASNIISERALAGALSPQAAAERHGLIDELRRQRAIEQAKPEQLAYAVTPKEPEPSHLLERGDSRRPGPLVAPGGIASLVGVDASFGLPPDAPEALRRLALARWITSPRNPLFARVIVNRLWHYHFGAGLVETPNDFGFNGGKPTHPELLDWLASRLVEQNFSLKRLHREILLSAAYRQASTLRPDAARQDADNRLLWRKTPARLVAESVRDAMLAVAGELNPASGGPGYRDCTEVLRSGTYTYEPGDPLGPEFNRRSIYRVWTRGGRNGLLDAFDCPDPSTTSPKRAVTTTPLQALALLNNSFVLRMADRLAERAAREAGPGVDAQIVRAYQLAYSRDPSADELELAQRVVREHGLAVLARAIFNSSEFLYVD